MPLFACLSPRGANQRHLLRVAMEIKELLEGRGATPCQGDLLHSLLSAPRPLPREDSAEEDSAWGELPPAWLGTFDSLLPQDAGRGAGGLH